MTQDMVTYTKAYQELEESILIALDDAYSDGVDMDEAFVEIKDINVSVILSGFLFISSKA